MQKFLELTRARDILLDPKQKEAYDKKLSHELLAKKQQRAREAELDGKRRQMRDGAWECFGHFSGLLELISWQYAIDRFAVDGFLTVVGVAGM